MPMQMEQLLSVGYDLFTYLLFNENPLSILRGQSS